MCSGRGYSGRPGAVPCSPPGREADRRKHTLATPPPRACTGQALPGAEAYSQKSQGSRSLLPDRWPQGFSGKNILKSVPGTIAGYRLCYQYVSTLSVWAEARPAISLASARSPPSALLTPELNVAP